MSEKLRSIAVIVLFIAIILILTLRPTHSVSSSETAKSAELGGVKTAIATSTATTTATTTKKAIKKPEIKQPQGTSTVSYTIPEDASPKVKRILKDLIKCESGGNPRALNKVDRDGTSSYGLLQFKPSTFLMALKLIKPDATYQEAFNSIYNGDLQVKAWIAWYGDGKPVSWWRQQFPACSKKFNYWLE